MEITRLKVGVTYHEKFGQYDLGAGHPFRGDCFANVMRLFEEQGLLRPPNVILLKPSLPTKQDLLRVHDEEYVNRARGEESGPSDSPKLIHSTFKTWNHDDPKIKLAANPK